jgi:hypothetical protein
VSGTRDPRRILVYASCVLSTLNFLLLPAALKSLRTGETWTGLVFLLYGGLSLSAASLVFAWFLARHWRGSPWLLRLVTLWNMVAPIAAMFVYAAAGAALEGS